MPFHLFASFDITGGPKEQRAKYRKNVFFSSVQSPPNQPFTHSTPYLEKLLAKTDISDGFCVFVSYAYTCRNSLRLYFFHFVHSLKVFSRCSWACCSLALGVETNTSEPVARENVFPCSYPTDDKQTFTSCHLLCCLPHLKDIAAR